MTSLRRTLLITEIFPPRTGGSGRWFWEIYRRLPRPQFTIAAGTVPGCDEFDRTHDLNVVRLPLAQAEWGIARPAGLLAYLARVRDLRRLVKARDVAMIHCGRCLPEGVMALALKRLTGTPYACYVHGEDVSTARHSREHTWLVQRVLRGSAFVVANSRNTESMLRSEWAVPAERIELLHPGVDTERFVPASRDPITRASLGWGDRPVVLTVGRLQLRKGHDQMIRALSQIRREIPDVLYAIVGDGEQRTALSRLVDSEAQVDHVQFLGEIDDERLIACYQQCDLFALPNRTVARDIEGFGMVLLEAQACGRPVIAGDSGGTAETMRVPETGLIVNCDGPDQLARQVAELLGNPGRRQIMGSNARKWAVENFDWEALASQAARRFAATHPNQPIAAPEPTLCR